MEDKDVIKELENLIYGQGSLFKLFADNAGLHYLVQDILILVEERDEFQIGATIDSDDGESPLIRVTTGSYQKIREVSLKGVSILSKKSTIPWTILGFEKNSFADILEFGNFLSVVILDFIILHELGHIIRGHVAYNFELSKEPLNEILKTESKNIKTIKRISLEIDADSIAIYHLITLSDFLLIESNTYSKIKKDKSFVIIIGLISKIVFAILTDLSQPTNNTIRRKKSLIAYHKDLTHPHPSVRQEFANQRILQLARNGKEKKVYKKCMDDSYSIFFQLVEGGLFSHKSIESWLFSPKEVADFLNILIDDIETASNKGWIVQNTRMEKAINEIDRLRLLKEE